MFLEITNLISVWVAELRNIRKAKFIILIVFVAKKCQNYKKEQYFKSKLNVIFKFSDRWTRVFPDFWNT